MSSVFFPGSYGKSTAAKPANAMKTIAFGFNDVVKYV
jgi:hypothetical protein